MEYVRIHGEFPRLSNSAVTLGKFDGIHRGHQKLVEEILKQKEEGAQAVLFAFVSSGQMIFTCEERAELLEKMGLDILLECPLDDRMRHMKAEAFVREILVGDLQVSHVAVGEDFRFGFERKGTPKLLEELGRKYGFTVKILPKEMEDSRKISSTYIREKLRKGSMEKVSSLLGRNFFVKGTVEHGRGLGHKLLFPTVNLVPSDRKLMPPNGVYVTISRFGERVFKGITNVGYKPTVGEKFLGVETYLFDCEEDLYGQECVVEFLKFQRPEEKFPSFEALRNQMQKDAASGKKYFEDKTGCVSVR
ncbi:MAG: bifunctional riboflavin kinase/FAD synthetase [Blautia sp.]|nr:bifunctional riboflavin kinase/FAD synthetase [Blautia sp.]MDY4000184.1 bifunctional riboflavin kinase/FAD synthetase [Blautia sp.]